MNEVEFFGTLKTLQELQHKVDNAGGRWNDLQEYLKTVKREAEDAYWAFFMHVRDDLFAYVSEHGKGASKKVVTPYGEASLNTRSSMKVTNESKALAFFEKLLADGPPEGAPPFPVSPVTRKQIEETSISVSLVNDEQRRWLNQFPEGDSGFKITLPGTFVNLGKVKEDPPAKDAKPEQGKETYDL